LASERITAIVRAWVPVIADFVRVATSRFLVAGIDRAQIVIVAREYCEVALTGGVIAGVGCTGISVLAHDVYVLAALDGFTRIDRTQLAIVARIVRIDTGVCTGFAAIDRAQVIITTVFRLVITVSCVAITRVCRAGLAITAVDVWVGTGAGIAVAEV